MTDWVDDVDGPVSPRAVMWSIGQIVERDGITKQAVSKKVKDLVAKHGLTVERDGKGRVTTVNVAQYDLLRGKFGDPSKAQAPVAQPLADSRESYDEALRQRTWHEAERKRIELDELKGELLRAKGMIDAVRQCGERINRAIDSVENTADDLAAAVAREGSHGLRVGLKQVAVRLRASIAKSLADIAAGAPQREDEGVEEAAA